MKKKKKMKNYRSDYEKKILDDTRWFSLQLRNILKKYLVGLNNEFKKMVFYSLFPGGKRIRPLLMFAIGEMLKVNKKDLIVPACSVELIHNYSLIHDDLPSMDNDDYRRGKLTVHRKFGEANAILIGDGLLSLAFEVLSNWDVKDINKKEKVIQLVSKTIGFDGLVKGQLLDIKYNSYFLTGKNKKFLEKKLYEICENKTAKLIQVCVLIPAVLCETDKRKWKILTKIGHEIGMLFQITDDLIDYISGQDVNKFSYPKVYTIDETKILVNNLYSRIEKQIRQNFRNSEYLLYLVNKIISRTK